MEGFWLLCAFATLIFSLTVKSIGAQVDQVTLKPTDDTYVDSGSPDSNYGGQKYLQIMDYNNQTNGNETDESIVWLKFNLSSVPEGAVIDGATLQLWASSVNGSLNVNAYLGTDLLNESAIISWTELTMTYSNMPYYNTTSMDSVLVEASGQWYNWSVVYAVTNALNGNLKLVSIVMQEPNPSSSTTGVQFSSKEDTAYYSPTLTVHWSGVIPEFPTFIILPLFMIATLLAVMVYRKRSARARQT